MESRSIPTEGYPITREGQPCLPSPFLVLQDETRQGWGHLLPFAFLAKQKESKQTGRGVALLPSYEQLYKKKGGSMAPPHVVAHLANKKSRMQTTRGIAPHQLMECLVRKKREMQRGVGGPTPIVVHFVKEEKAKAGSAGAPS